MGADCAGATKFRVSTVVLSLQLGAAYLSMSERGPERLDRVLVRLFNLDYLFAICGLEIRFRCGPKKFAR
jgi:hypothetical protein